MSRPTRAQVASALLAQVNSSTFNSVAQRLKLWSDVANSDQPALFVTRAHEAHAPRPRGMPSKVTLECNLVVYFRAGESPSDIPAIEADNLMDAIEESLRPTTLGPDGFFVQTLGGIVDHCWIEGRVFKDPGDLDGQGMLVVPVKILLP